MNYLSILKIYDEKQVNLMRNDLRDKVNALIQEEKKYCWEKGIESQMNPEKYNRIEILIQKCKNAYQVECLERMIVSDYEIPTFEEIEERAAAMETEAFHV